MIIDSEGAGGEGRADALDVETRTKVCAAFCETIKSAGYEAGVYASRSWYNANLDVKELDKYVGKKLRLRLIEIKTERRKEIIASQRVIIEEEKAAKEAAKAAKAAADELAEVPFFNHRGNNVVDDSVAKLQDAAAAKSYAKSHGIQVADEVEEAVLKANA